MPTYFKDPSLLTRVRLKKELHANGIHLPDKEQPKAFYVKMYRQHLSPLAWDSGVSIPSEQEVYQRLRFIILYVQRLSELCINWSPIRPMLMEGLPT